MYIVYFVDNFVLWNIIIFVQTTNFWAPTLFLFFLCTYNDMNTEKRKNHFDDNIITTYIFRQFLISSDNFNQVLELNTMYEYGQEKKAKVPSVWTFKDAEDDHRSLSMIVVMDMMKLIWIANKTMHCNDPRDEYGNDLLPSYLLSFDLFPAASKQLRFPGLFTAGDLLQDFISG